MNVNWNEPIETVPCDRNPEPVPCEFGGFDGDGDARVAIAGRWIGPNGKNLGNSIDSPWYYNRLSGFSISGEFSGFPAIRNRIPQPRPMIADDIGWTEESRERRIIRELVQWRDIPAWHAAITRAEDYLKETAQ